MRIPSAVKILRTGSAVVLHRTPAPAPASAPAPEVEVEVHAHELGLDRAAERPADEPVPTSPEPGAGLALSILRATTDSPGDRAAEDTALSAVLVPESSAPDVETLLEWFTAPEPAATRSRPIRAVRVRRGRALSAAPPAHPRTATRARLRTAGAVAGRSVARIVRAVLGGVRAGAVGGALLLAHAVLWLGRRCRVAGARGAAATGARRKDAQRRVRAGFEGGVRALTRSGGRVRVAGTSSARAITRSWTGVGRAARAGAVSSARVLGRSWSRTRGGVHLVARSGAGVAQRSWTGLRGGSRIVAVSTARGFTRSSGRLRTGVRTGAAGGTRGLARSWSRLSGGARAGGERGVRALATWWGRSVERWRAAVSWGGRVVVRSCAGVFGRVGLLILSGWRSSSRARERIRASRAGRARVRDAPVESLRPPAPPAGSRGALPVPRSSAPVRDRLGTARARIAQAVPRLGRRRVGARVAGGARTLARAWRRTRAVPSTRGRLRRRVVLAVPLLLAVLAVAAVGAVVTRTAGNGIEDGSHDAAPAATSDPLPTDRPTIMVIGDTAGAGASSDRSWTALIATSLHARVVPLQSRGAGYTTRGSSGSRFADRALEVPPGADAVLFVGGAADVGAAPIDEVKAATAAFASVRQQAPDAAVLVVGPLRSDDADGSAIDALRSSLRAATQLADVSWADPVSAGWLDSASDPTGPASDSDERVIASRLSALLEPRLR